MSVEVLCFCVCIHSVELLKWIKLQNPYKQLSGILFDSDSFL